MVARAAAAAAATAVPGATNNPSKFVIPSDSSWMPEAHRAEALGAVEG